jgi:hypothetical protein
MKHLSEEDLVLIYYGEPGVAEEARQHLAECAECHAAADALAQTLNLCNDWPVPDPDLDFERRVWTGRPSVWSMPGVWIGIAAAVVLIVSAFLLGRVTRPQPPVILTGLSDQARERILRISLADHLDRAGIVMTEVCNTGDIAGERALAEDLVGEGRLLRQALARHDHTATLAVFDQIQRVLTEVAHAEPAESPELKQQIGDESLVFKARVMETNLRTQGQKL